MLRSLRFLVAITCFATAAASTTQAFAAPRSHISTQEPFQETGFLNRHIDFHGEVYHFQVYLPENWRPDDHKHWPIILFLHGRGERGSDGMWQTQIGLPEAVRDHPERWPFIIVMPQCPQIHYWTDPDMMAMAMAVLDRETEEFHADPARTYLTGLSLGGYGAWELARSNPDRWAAVAIAAGGIFWSYKPQRWRQADTLPAAYAHAIGSTPIWLFHGSDDPIVSPRESELMFTAFRAQHGHIRLWIYQGLKHDCWTRAFNEPDLPRWLLSHRREPHQVLQPMAERLVIPLHPPALRLTAAQLESFVGDYLDLHNQPAISIYTQGNRLYQKNSHGQVSELAVESLSVLFYPNGSSISRLFVERDSLGRILALTFRDDRHEERWERMRSAPRIRFQPK